MFLIEIKLNAIKIFLSLFLESTIDASLTNYWPFDNHVNDIIGGANLYGGFTIGSKSFTSDRFGYWQSALYLNKAYYQMPNGVYFNGDYTVCVWVKMNTINGRNRIMSIGTSSYTVNSIIFSLVYNSSPTPYVYISANYTGNQLISPTNLPLNQWTHIAFTLSGSIGTIYLNGTNVKQGTTLIPSNTNRTYNYFGTSWYSGNILNQYPNAIFDEVKIFNRCLSQREIQFIINNQTSSSALSISIFFNLFLIFIKLVSHF